VHGSRAPQGAPRLVPPRPIRETRRVRRLAVALCAATALSGCGGADESVERDRVQGLPQADHAAEVERNPYAVTCGDLARQPESPEAQKLVIRAEFALAQEPALRKRVRAMTENRVGRSVYWALTEFCEGEDETFTPGERAVAAVRRGEFLVQPRPEAWNRP
jgi:hypothetical protein